MQRGGEWQLETGLFQWQCLTFRISFTLKLTWHLPYCMFGNVLARLLYNLLLYCKLIYGHPFLGCCFILFYEHYEYVAEVGHKSAQEIVKFTCNKGRQYISAALKLYWAKTLSQLMYDTRLVLSSPILSMHSLSKYDQRLQDLYSNFQNVSPIQFYIWNLSWLK